MKWKHGGFEIYLDQDGQFVFHIGKEMFGSKTLAHTKELISLYNGVHLKEIMPDVPAWEWCGVRVESNKDGLFWFTVDGVLYSRDTLDGAKEVIYDYKKRGAKL